MKQRNIILFRKYPIGTKINYCGDPYQIVGYYTQIRGHKHIYTQDHGKYDYRLNITGAILISTIGDYLQTEISFKALEADENAVRGPWQDDKNILGLKKLDEKEEVKP